MRCSAPNCRNDSRRITKSHGITFHVFPKLAALREAWLRALGKHSWELKERAVVCSQHFLKEDLYLSESGLRKVRTGAVPLIIQDSINCGYGEPATFKACRICLVMNAKLFPLRTRELQEAYETLTGIMLCKDDKLPQMLCVECVQRLLNCSRFRNKSLRANSLMLKVISKHFTVQTIQMINRHNNQLSSSLTTNHYDANHFDTHIQYEEPEDIEYKLPKVTEPCDTDENEIFFIEDDCVDKTNKEEIEDEIFFTEEDCVDETNKEEIEDEIFFTEDDSVDKTNKEEIADVKEFIDRRRRPFLSKELDETLFIVTNLTVEEQIADIVNRQESSNYKNSVFKCTECFKGFLYEDAYNSHMSRHTNQCGEYECGVCKTHFKHPRAVRKHITAHHAQRFSCKKCTYKTQNRQTARMHEKWHKGTKYKCPHCQDEFVKFTTYMGHIRIKHPSDFVCELCGYSFVSAKGIELHKRLKHRLEDKQIPEDGPLCELCNVRFVSSEAYRRHVNISARHNSDSDKERKELNKPKKGRKTNEAKEIERQRDKESGEKRQLYPRRVRKVEEPIPCEQCGAVLPNFRSYRWHFKREHPGMNRTKYPAADASLMCDQCGKIFMNNLLLLNHMTLHSGKTPYQCDHCNKSFRLNSNLALHMKVHDVRRRKYECHVCGKMFSLPSNRKRHMLLHTGLKPYKCNACEKCFVSSWELRLHTDHVHLKKPWPKRVRNRTKKNDMPSVKAEY